MSHSIDYGILRKAALDLLTIDNAGYGQQFDTELFDATTGDQSFRLEQSHYKHLAKVGVDAVNQFAERLADVLQIPSWQAREIAYEVCGHRTKRSVALNLLDRLSREVQRVNAMAARRQLAGRRSA